MARQSERSPSGRVRHDGRVPDGRGDTWIPGTWHRSTLKPHQPSVLRSDDETRVIAINLPAGELLQEHQVHERAWLVVADGRRGGRAERAHRCRRPRPPGPLRAQRAARGAGGQRRRLVAAPVAVARRGPPATAGRLSRPARIKPRMDPARKRKIRLVVALGVAVCLASALLYTSFSASTEASKPSELEAGSLLRGDREGREVVGEPQRRPAAIPDPRSRRDRVGTGGLQRRGSRSVPRGPRGDRVRRAEAGHLRRRARLARDQVPVEVHQQSS